MFFTCEDVVRELPGIPVEEWKVPGKTAIPAGRYRIDWALSPHFGRMLPHLSGIPGYTGVLIHPGNTEADTEGCILPGMVVTASGVGRSREACEKLYPLIEGACKEEGCWITITNPVKNVT